MAIIQSFLSGGRPLDIAIAELLELGIRPKEVQAIIEELNPPNKEGGLKGDARRVYEAAQRQIKAFLSAYVTKYQRVVESAAVARGTDLLRWDAPSSGPGEKRKHIKVTNEHFFGDPNLAENMTLEELALITEMLLSAEADLPASLVFQEVLEFLHTLLKNNIIISAALATKGRIPQEINDRLRAYALHHGQNGDIHDPVPYQHKPHMLLQTLYRTYLSAKELDILIDLYRQFTEGGCLEAAIRGPELWIEEREAASRRAKRDPRKEAEPKKRGLRDILTSVLQIASLEDNFPELPEKRSGEEALEGWLTKVITILHAALEPELIKNKHEGISREHIENLIRACALNLAGVESLPISAMPTPSPFKGRAAAGPRFPSAGASPAIVPGSVDLLAPFLGDRTPTDQIDHRFPSGYSEPAKAQLNFHTFAIANQLYSPDGIDGACFWEALSYALFGVGIRMTPQDLLAITTTYMQAHPEQFVGAIVGDTPEQQLQNLNAFIDGQVLGTWANEIIVGATVSALQAAGHQVQIVMDSYNAQGQAVGLPIPYFGQNGSAEGLTPLSLVNFALVHFLAHHHEMHDDAFAFVEQAQGEVLAEVSISVLPILYALRVFFLELPAFRFAARAPSVTGSAAAAPFVVPHSKGAKARQTGLFPKK